MLQTIQNGGDIEGFGRNFPLRGGKLTIFEGGVRSRAFVYKKGMRSGDFNGLFHVIDWVPTILGMIDKDCLCLAFEFFLFF
jgi:arylsulfatase A-like enzyme